MKSAQLGPDRVSTVEISAPGGIATTARIYRNRQPNADTDAASTATLILAHGAGAGQQHPFMIAFASGLAERGLDVVTFNFVYMEQRRKVPDRMPALVECYRAVIAAAREELPSAREHLFIGGKSMGGRAATHVAADDQKLVIDGLVLLGYPLHPPGRLDQLRDAHLPGVNRPMLFVQGSRDTFGTPEELKPVFSKIMPTPALHVVEGGDHSLKVGGKDAAARTKEIYAKVQDTIVQWIAASIGRK
jgi:predicted alpha/beta-hydrolase family hydrolase